MLDPAPIARLLLQLNNELERQGLTPLAEIVVDSPTGNAFRYMSGDYVTHEDRRGEPTYCATVVGVAVHKWSKR